jgi:peptidoglycan/LPS O-acetylase OafA/YrhL
MREQEETGTINLRQFYIRRAYRIIPPAYAYLLVITFCFRDSIPHKYLIAAYFYLTSPFGLQSPWNLNHLWSLSVEEQFYLVWPVFMVFGFMFARRFAFLAIALAPIFRFVLHGHWSQGQEWAFPSVADSLAAGCLLALLQPKLKNCAFFTWRGFPLIWAFALSIPALYHNRFVIAHDRLASTVGLSFLNFGIVLCIQNAIAVRPRVLNLPVVVWVGTLSYSLYLWQMPFANSTNQSWITTFPQNVALAFLAAAISFYAIEQPFLRLREHLAQKSDSLLVVVHLERLLVNWSRQRTEMEEMRAD